MDWGIVMGAITAILLAVFLGVVAWAWRKERKQAFDEAARYPLSDLGDMK